MRTRIQRAILAVGAAVLLLSTACTVVIDDGNGGGGGGAAPQVILIQIANATNTALDPEIYISPTVVSVDELFADANKFTRFGVATLGIIDHDRTDQFEVECANAAMIGTRGGRFGDDLTAPVGTGRQIVLTRDLNVFCEGSVTFTFARSGGAFTTTFDVSP